MKDRTALIAVAALVGLVLLAVGYPVFAQTGQAVLTCTAPTTNTDGSVIAGAISYKFYRGTTAGSQTTASPVQTNCAYTFTGLAVGTHYFSATATVGGIESAKSSVVNKAIAAPIPNPPSGLTVAADLTAYSDDKIRNGKLMRAVGLVAPGTACSASEALISQGVTYYAVLSSAVTASPGVSLPLVVYAQCS